MNGLTDKEFRHYQELYNMDPIVQRLCRVDHDLLNEKDDEIDDLHERLELAELSEEYWKDLSEEYLRKIRVLEEKINMWNILESK
jgi:hypothetical protein